jgi:formylmethanofuran dehydrogenase subunit E
MAKTKTYICDECGQEYVHTSFEYINHRIYGTVCKICAFNAKKKAATGGLLTAVVNLLRGGD